MPQYIYKISLVLLVLSLASYSIELSFITSFLVLGLTISKKINANFLTGGLLISSVAVIGLISTYTVRESFYNILKDFIYFTRPIFILLAGYFVVKRINSKGFVFNTVIFISLYFAIKHLLLIIMDFTYIDSYVYLRSLGGKQNHIEIIALVFLLFTPYKPQFKNYNRTINRGIIFIIFISFILYLSRTMFLTLFFFYLGHKGYLFLNKRFFKGMTVFIFISLLIGAVLSNIETHRDSKGIKAFIYKTQNSFTELFEPVETSTILRDKRSLWEHWRAYEAQKAIEQLDDNGMKAWAIGMGFGPQVQLDTEVKLDGKIFSEVPSIHNGFIFVLFKTGIIGLSFYILFILYVLIKHQEFRKSKNSNLFNKLLVATGLYMLFNSFVITGFFRPGEFSIFLCGILMASKYKYEKYIDLKEQK